MTAQTVEQQCQEVSERVMSVWTRESILDNEKEKFIVQQIRWKQQMEMAQIKMESEHVCYNVEFTLTRDTFSCYAYLVIGSLHDP